MNHHQDTLDQQLHPAPSSRTKQKKFLIGAIGLVIAIASLVSLNLSNTDTQGVGTYRNWSADAIIQGGAITEKEMIEKYNANASGVQGIFGHYGIGLGDLSGKSSTIVHGRINRDGTVVRNDTGKVIATGAYSVSRKPFYDSRGNAPKAVDINGTTLYEGPNMGIFVRDVDAYILLRDGEFYRAIISSCANPVMGQAVKVEKPKTILPITQPKASPVTLCSGLTARQIKRNIYEFSASATAANGAKIIAYTFNFDDDKYETIHTTNSTQNITHTFDKPGTYDVNVTVHFEVNGEAQRISSPDCMRTVTISEELKVATYRCETLTKRAILGEENTYVFNLSYTANNAELQNVVYNFGDGIEKKYAPKDATEVTHTYGIPDNYTVVTTLNYIVEENGKKVEKSASCTESVTVPKADKCPLPGKEHLPKNSPECTEPIETPAELPQTGLAEWLAGGTGVAALAAALYYWNISRKHLTKTMLKK